MLELESKSEDRGRHLLNIMFENNSKITQYYLFFDGFLKNQTKSEITNFSKNGWHVERSSAFFFRF